jgi:hypothetical protein
MVFTNLISTTTPLSYVPCNYYVGIASCVNCFNQLVTQNLCCGATASNDIIVSNNLTTDTTYYGDFGINSSVFAGSGSLNAPNMVYVTATTGDLSLGTTTANPLHFVINNGSSDAATIKTTCQLQLPAYSSTSAFTGTAIGYLGYDASGNILTCGLIGGGGIIVLDTGTCSSVRCGVSSCASGAYSAALGGQSNLAQGINSFIGGGNCNSVFNVTSGCLAYGSVVVGGVGNNTTGGTWALASCAFTVAPRNCDAGLMSFVGGGFQNSATGNCSVVGGGFQNKATGNFNFVGAGTLNTASGNISFVGAGYNNLASGGCSLIVGGFCNTASALFSSVLGGQSNVACGSYSGAFGCGLTASAACTFYSNNLFSCNTTTTCQVGAFGGQLFTNNASSCICFPNAASFCAGAIVTSGLNFSTNVYCGSITVPNSALYGASISIDQHCFAAAAQTVTFSQSGNPNAIRTSSSIYSLKQFGGANSGTITHASSIQSLGWYCNNATAGCVLTVCNNYGLLINDQNGYSGSCAICICNRWGVYQEGATDTNFFCAPIKQTSIATSCAVCVNATGCFIGYTPSGSSSSVITLNPQTASYTLVAGDAGVLVQMNVATANTLTIPLNSSVPFTIGQVIEVIQQGAGQTTITPTAGVTINSYNSYVKLSGIYAAATLTKIATNTWYLIGNLSA